MIRPMIEGRSWTEIERGDMFAATESGNCRLCPHENHGAWNCSFWGVIRGTSVKDRCNCPMQTEDIVFGIAA